jgi:hypothetical protein
MASLIFPDEARVDSKHEKKKKKCCGSYKLVHVLESNKNLKK